MNLSTEEAEQEKKNPRRHEDKGKGEGSAVRSLVRK